MGMAYDGDVPIRMKRGFTLIELAIVMAVIGILATFIGVNVFTSLSKGKDARRKSDLAQLQRGIELYVDDQNPPSYPATGFFTAALCGQCWSQSAGCSGNLYLRKVPCDPRNNLTPYPYTRDVSDSLKYTLVACLENSADGDRDQTKDPQCAAASYTVHEP